MTTKANQVDFAALLNSIDYSGEYTVTHKDKPVKSEEEIDNLLQAYNVNNDNNEEGSATRKLADANFVDGQLIVDSIKNRFLLQIIHESTAKYMNGESRQIPSIETCLKLCNDIKDRVKSLPYTRYKYIVYVTTGDDLKQDLEVASRCVWDDKTDRFCSVKYQCNGRFLVVNIYALYVI